MCNMRWNTIFSENRVLVCLQEAEGLRRLQESEGIDNSEAIKERFEMVNDHVGFCSLHFLRRQSGKLKGLFGCRVESV